LIRTQSPCEDALGLVVWHVGPSFCSRRYCFSVRSVRGSESPVPPRSPCSGEYDSHSQEQDPGRTKDDSPQRRRAWRQPSALQSCVGNRRNAPGSLSVASKVKLDRYPRVCSLGRKVGYTDICPSSTNVELPWTVFRALRSTGESRVS